MFAIVARLQPSFLHACLRLVGLVAALGLASCGNNIQPEYSLSLRLLQGQDLLASATSVTLEVVGTGYRVTSPVVSGQAPRLSLRGLNPRATQIATFAVTLNNAAGPVAYGKSPPILLSEEENLIRLVVQVQAFGSLAQPMYLQTIPRLSDGSVITAFARDGEAPAVPTPVMLGGNSLDSTGAERPTRAGFLYNPFLHALTDANFFPTTSSGAATWARNDGTIWLFGGRIPKPVTDTNPQQKPQDFSGAADQLGVGQYLSALRVDLLATYPQATPAFARANAAMTEVPGGPAPFIYVFGGEVVQGEPAALSAMSSVVRIDLNPLTPATMVVQMAAANMLVPRTRHTATTVSTDPRTVPSRTEVLLFGGSAPDAPVAEIFDPVTLAFTSLGPDAGPHRWGHKVIPLPDGRWLIACGADSEGKPMPDVRIYDPSSRTFTAPPLALATPRSNAACFSAGADLVIAGGRDVANGFVATAEIFDLASLMPVATVPAVPRYGAKDMAMADGTVMIVGGRESVEGLDVPSNLYEFYRPRPTP